MNVVERGLAGEVLVVTFTCFKDTDHCEHSLAPDSSATSKVPKDGHLRLSPLEASAVVLWQTNHADFACLWPGPCLVQSVVWEMSCVGFRHSAGFHARVILDGAACRLRKLGVVRDVLGVLGVDPVVLIVLRTPVSW